MLSDVEGEGESLHLSHRASYPNGRGGVYFQSVNQLPDAEKRIAICEQSFKRSYGENMDRVTSLKGSAGNEKCLILRLHLLKAILFFHRNDRFEAKRLLSTAEVEMSMLKVDEGSVTALIEMGGCYIL